MERTKQRRHAGQKGPNGRKGPNGERNQAGSGKQAGLIRKIFDFLFYAIIVVCMLTVALLWLPKWEALVTATVIFLISAGMIVHVSFSSSQRQTIHEAPYHEINYKIFSPFALVFSFAVICYLLNGFQPKFFIGTIDASIAEFSIFAIDNIIRVIFWDLPEVYGLAASPITHNVDSLIISTLVFLFRVLIGLSLIKMVILFLRN